MDSDCSSKSTETSPKNTRYELQGLKKVGLPVSDGSPYTYSPICLTGDPLPEPGFSLNIDDHVIQGNRIRFNYHWTAIFERDLSIGTPRLLVHDKGSFCPPFPDTNLPVKYPFGTSFKRMLSYEDIHNRKCYSAVFTIDVGDVYLWINVFVHPPRVKSGSLVSLHERFLSSAGFPKGALNGYSDGIDLDVYDKVPPGITIQLLPKFTEKND
jgi:hypothetical protein